MVWPDISYAQRSPGSLQATSFACSFPLYIPQKNNPAPLETMNVHLLLCLPFYQLTRHLTCFLQVFSLCRVRVLRTLTLVLEIESYVAQTTLQFTTNAGFVSTPYKLESCRRLPRGNASLKSSCMAFSQLVINGGGLSPLWVRPLLDW